MTILVTGSVVKDESGDPLAQVLVEARGDWALTSDRLNATRTRTDGTYTLALNGVSGGQAHPASFRVRAVSLSGRAISADRDVNGATGDVALEPIRVKQADREGFAVTLLTGQAPLVSEGNALKLLIDGEEAFGRIAADMAAATKTIDLTQLFFAVADFKPDPEDEHPKLIFVFGSPVNPDNPTGTEPPRPHQPRPDDVRPDRLLVRRANQHVNVRMLFNDPQLGFPEGLFWAIVGPPAAVGLPFGLLALLGVGFPLLPFWLAITAFAYAFEYDRAVSGQQEGSDVKNVKTFFDKAMASAPPTAGTVVVRGLRQALPEHGVLHCKMVIFDGTRAVVVGSPFTQRYFDGPEHAIDEPRRGRNTDPAVHDVSIGVVGPAVNDLHSTLMLYWNEEAAAGQKIDPIPPAPRGSGEDGVATVQVVRTLSGRRFDSLHGKSEKGIIEAYQRAFATAKQFIYLENQYLTDTSIVDGLCYMLTEVSTLQVILLVNIKPDIVFYPGSQERQIRRLRKAGGDRFGAFTRWSYRVAPAPVSVAQVYLHTKAGMVDDTWCTIGSANLDGLSMDHNLLLSPLTIGETTASELNISVIGGPDQQALAGLLRRRLWAEHLGFHTNGVPDPNEPALQTPPAGGWLKLWRDRVAAAKLHIAAQTIVPLPGFVLEYPEEDGGSLTSPRAHLAALGIDVKLIRPVAKISQFDFYTNRWFTRSIEDKS
jgi:phosphatidylserine/phosphatidylglycerophosphate/cardiolipin synthase-like enzyme